MSNRTLKRLNLEHDWEALLCVPHDYIDCRTTSYAFQGEHEDSRAYRLKFTGAMISHTVDGRVLSQFSWSARRLEMEFIGEDGQSLWFSAFGAIAEWKDLAEGDVVDLVAGVMRYGKKMCLVNGQRAPAHAIGNIWVRYKGVSGRVSKESIEEVVRPMLANETAYRRCAAQVIGALGGIDEPGALQTTGAAERFSTMDELIKALHNPQEPEDGFLAKACAARLAAISVRAAAYAANARMPHPDSVLMVAQSDVGTLAAAQKEALTIEQKESIARIVICLRRPTPLVGLISGDVGTGKTLVYLLPLVAASLAGHRCAIVAPTQILCDQIASQISTRFAQSGVKVERVYAGAKIQDKDAILVGGVGLINAAKKAKYVPNVLVCDEQHKMATAAREAMLGPFTHMIEVSATPIPRTLAGAMYGGMEIFTLKKCPVNKVIHSEVIDLKDRPMVSSMLKWAMKTGQRAAVIYPLVQNDDPLPLDESDDEDEKGDKSPKRDVQSVLKAAGALQEHFPGKVAVIHGGMADEEKRAVLEQIRANERPLIVGSTIMETGIDIPSIAVMVVRDADRFGISQLHQLRGRLMRNGGEGHFVMMVESLDKLPDETLERLQTVAATSDGFKLAESDMVQRGFGSFGDAQSGATTSCFRLVKLGARDFLQDAQSKLQEEDPSLLRPRLVLSG